MDVVEKIDAFEKHVFDRQLNIAKILSDHFDANADDDPLAESAFAIVNLTFTYFEMLEQFVTGQSSQNQSPGFFANGFAYVFPAAEVDPNDVARLYSTIRCGMYHSAMPKDCCGLSRELQSPIANESGVLIINPKLLTQRIIEHFQQYCRDLRDGEHCDLQTNFEQMFDSFSQGAITVADATTSVTAEPTHDQT